MKAVRLREVWLYESVDCLLYSLTFEVTAAVAETIGGVLKEKGVEVDSFFVA